MAVRKGRSKRSALDQGQCAKERAGGAVGLGNCAQEVAGSVGQQLGQPYRLAEFAHGKARRGVGWSVKGIPLECSLGC